MSSRPRKRRTDASNVTHMRVPLDDDYEIVQSRTASLRWSHATVDSPRDELRGKTSWSVGESWYPEDNPEFDLEDDDGWYEEQLDKDVGDVLDGMASKSKEKVENPKESSTRPRVYWKRRHREEYLDELLQLDGRGDFIRATGCPDCIARGVNPPLPPEIRCRDCFTPDLTCSGCCVRRHTRHPFHRIEKWADSTFQKISLKDIGLTVHLNHGSMRCPLPSAADSRLLVLHTNGIHDIALSYCSCAREIPRHLQLLRRGLYPATHQNTRTCVTMSLLRLLHMLSLTAKISTYDFYRGLEGLTPQAATRRPKSRYRPLIRVLTQWRHLKMLKRAGRGHHPSGAFGTANGELALACPSCPHPGINLPDEWDKVPPKDKFLYALLICLDANFRLKNNLISNYSSDPGLGPGMAYMIDDGAYGEYVLSQADEDDISTCVGFQALAKATTRNTKGLRYSGVGMAVCGRSEMILPNGVGNLQKGERYANMDYIAASAIAATKLLIVCISYDIVCQWFINLFLRMTHWPPTLRPRAGLHLRPLIPKFHYWAHKEEGHEQYSFNYGDGAALSDGEAIERVWGGHNALAGSTKVSGPGTRQDILDDNFGYWNYLKYISMGHSLIKKYKEGISERNRQTEAHRGFTATLPEQLVAEWEDMCVRWSADTFPKSAPSPYEADDAGVTEAEVEKELDEREAAKRPPGVPPLHRTSAASFIKMGLELEESQRRLRAFAEQEIRIPRNLQSGKLPEQRALLRNSIEGWEQIRSVYIPGLVQLLEDQGTTVAGIWDSNPNPEDVQLWLPSTIPASLRRAACVEDLPHTELQLRIAQCTSSLQGLRQVLRLKTRMVYFKNKNIRGQRDGVRSRSIIDRVHKRALQFVQKYRIAREARLKLEGPGEWEATFRELKNEDVRSYSAPKKKRDADRRGIWEDGHEPPSTNEDQPFSSSESESEIELDPEDAARETEKQRLERRKKGTGETRKELSWIWQTGKVQIGSTDSPDHILRAEWAKSRARVHRATEEVALVREEMRRVLAFLEYSQQTWAQRISQRDAVTSALAEGLRSYANKQIIHQQDLANTFRVLWKTPLQDIDATVSAAPDLTTSSDPLHSVADAVDANGNANRTRSATGCVDDLDDADNNDDDNADYDDDTEEGAADDGDDV